MKFLFIEPYYGGSHKAFFEGWRRFSGFDFDLLSLPANKWKWRMRHGAVYFAGEVSRLLAEGRSYNGVFCSDMLNLAEFIGLCGEDMTGVGKVLYFHENQLTYPQQFESERDYQYVMTNFTSALCADKVVFNSGFHRDEFLRGLERFFRKMPDNQPLSEIEVIGDKCEVIYPGIDVVGCGGRNGGCLKILWAARWEHDKNPEDFFEAMKILKDKGAEFELNVIGEQFREVPEVFGWARDYFADNIVRWGYQESREDYVRCLRSSDVVVSTAVHEFYGIGVLEAVSAGCVPVLPRRLSYPELFGSDERFFYDGTVRGLVGKLEGMVECPEKVRMASDSGFAERFSWDVQGGRLDDLMREVCG